MLRRRTLVTLAVLVCCASVALAQRGFGGFGGRWVPFSIQPNAKYDGRFTFVRVKYETAPGGYWWRGLPSWAHGYPLAEQNLMKIMNELSNFRPHIAEDNVYALDDPDLYRYPIVYMTEGGFWAMTDEDAKGLRAYLLKGGFAIFDDFRDDFRGAGWDHFEENMHRVLPEAKIVDMAATHQIFHSFFEINSFDIIPQYYDRGKPVLRGIFEDNDPSKRLLAIVNYAPNQSQCYLRLPFTDLEGSQWRLRDQLETIVHERAGGELQARGLYLDMSPWQTAVFALTRQAS